MAADQRFRERVARIEAGRQWAPEGVVHATGSQQGSEPRRHAPAGLLLGLVLTVPLVLFFVAPDLTGEILSAVLADPSLETAQAALLGD